MRPQIEHRLRQRTAGLPLETIGGEEGFDGKGPSGFRDLIEAASIVAVEARVGLQRWVDAGRREGLSWSEIGEILGISKQAALKRFRSESDVEDAVEPGQIKVRLGATAFNEERILDQEGRKGNELMRVDMLALVFRTTSVTWEYHRTLAMTSALAEAKLARDGWVYVAGWFAFHYFKRQVVL